MSADWEAYIEDEELGLLAEARLRHVVPVREPLVLVSQIQRSGGTLLSQLFDAHPELHAHPSEIYIGHPKKWDWPPLDLAAPATWFDVLYERPVELHAREGYVKEKEARATPGHDVFPFLFLPALQRRIFEQAAAGASTEREVLDAYFTSYFNAWLDNQNLSSGPKKAVTGFTPRFSLQLERVERMLAAYPDGLLISIVRDPQTWYRSARGYRPIYADPDKAAARWRASTEAAIGAAGRWPDRVLLLTYEQLVRDTEATMRRVADRMGIAWADTLLEPTFNGRAIRANSSERKAGPGVIADRVVLSADEADEEAFARIRELAGSLYERAVALRAGS